MKKRKIYPEELKARVALKALQETRTIAELSSEYEVHSSQWKKRLQENIADIFIRRNKQEPGDKELIENLYKQIGKSQVEIDWL